MYYAGILRTPHASLVADFVGTSSYTKAAQPAHVREHIGMTIQFELNNYMAGMPFNLLSERSINLPNG